MSLSLLPAGIVCILSHTRHYWKPPEVVANRWELVTESANTDTAMASIMQLMPIFHLMCLITFTRAMFFASDCDTFRVAEASNDGRMFANYILDAQSGV